MILDGVPASSLAGVDAGVLRRPSLGGLEVESVSAPGTRGRVVADSTQASVSWLFEVDVEGSTPQQIEQRVQAFTAWVDPRRGTRTLTLFAGDQWSWPEAVVVGGFEWTDYGSFWRAEVTVETNPDAVPAVDETWSRTGAGSVSVRRVKGGAPSYPTIEIKGTLSASQTVTVTVGSFSTVVTGPLTSSQTLRLDYDQFEFARWTGTAKTASLIPKMSNLDRLELWPDTAYTVAVATTGTVSSVTVKANSRNV